MTVITTLHYGSIIPEINQLYSKKELKSLINIGIMKSYDVYDLNTIIAPIKYNSKIKNKLFIYSIMDIVLFFLNSINIKHIKKCKLAKIIHNTICGIALNIKLLNQIIKAEKMSNSNETNLNITIKYKRSPLAILKMEIINSNKANNEMNDGNTNTDSYSDNSNYDNNSNNAINNDNTDTDNDSCSDNNSNNYNNYDIFDDDTFSISSDNSDNLDCTDFLIQIDNIMVYAPFKSSKLINNPNIKLLDLKITEEVHFTDEECIVCLEKNNVSITTCGHYIHKECLLLVDNMLCPVCRISLEKYIETFVHKDDHVLLRYFNYEKKLISDNIENLTYVIDEVFYYFNREDNYTAFCNIYASIFNLVLQHNKYNISEMFDIIISYIIKGYMYFRRIINTSAKKGVFVYNLKNVSMLINYILNFDCNSCLNYISINKATKYYKVNFGEWCKENVNVIIKIGDSLRYYIIKPQKKSLKFINFRSRMLAFINFDKNFINEDKNYNIITFEYTWCKNFYNNIKKN